MKHELPEVVQDSGRLSNSTRLISRKLFDAEADWNFDLHGSQSDCAILRSNCLIWHTCCLQYGSPSGAYVLRKSPLRQPFHPQICLEGHVRVDRM